MCLVESQTIGVIPRHWNPTELQCVDFKRRLHDKFPYLNAYIRPTLVHEAARRLINDPLYLENGVRYDFVWDPANLMDELSFLLEGNNVAIEEIDEVEEPDPVDSLFGNFDTLVNQLPLEPRMDTNFC